MVSAVQVAATATLSGLAEALTLPVDPAGTSVNAALVAACDPVWFATAASDTAALVAAGVGTSGVRLALDQAAAARGEVRTLYVVSELSYPYALSFGVRAG